MDPDDDRLRNTIRAVVIDANIFGKGLPNLVLLGSLALRLANKGITALVPEPVAWEWAEHLAVEVENYRITAQSVRKSLAQAGIDQGQFSLPYFDKEATVGAFLDALEDLESVVVLPLSGPSARAALRDQILQSGAGNRKSGVKTGASDSAWLRDALTQVAGNPESLIIITKNRKDVLAHCKALGIMSPRMYGSTGELPNSIFKFVTAPEDITALVARHILGRLPLSYVDDDHGEVPQERIELGTLSPSPDEFGDRERVHVSDIELRRITHFVAITDVNIEIGGDEDIFRTASATAWFLADVNAAVYSLDRDGQVVMDSWQFDQSPVVAPLLIELERDEIVSVTRADEARVYLDDQTDSVVEGNEGLEEFQRAFEMIRGIEFPEDWLERADLGISANVSGRPVHLSFSGDRWGEWAMGVTISGSNRADVTCVYDHTRSGYLDGDEAHPFSLYALYSVVDGVQLRGIYPAVAHVVRVLYGG